MVAWLAGAHAPPRRPARCCDRESADDDRDDDPRLCMRFPHCRLTFPLADGQYPPCAETMRGVPGCSGARTRASSGSPERRDHLLRVGRAQLLGSASRWLPRHTVRAYSSGSAGLHRPGLEPAAHVLEAGAHAAAPRSPPARRSSRGPRSRPCARRRAARRPPRRPGGGSGRCCPSRRTGPRAGAPGRSAACRRANRASWSLIQWKTAFEKAASTGSSSSSSVRSRGRAPPPAARRRSARAPARSSRGRRRRPPRRPSRQPLEQQLRSPGRCRSRRPAPSRGPRSGSRSSTGRAISTCGAETRS